MTDRKGPVLIEIEDTHTAPGPSEAPPVPDTELPAPKGQAMATVAALTGRPPSRLARWFWSLLVGLIGTFASIAAWNFVTGLIASTPILGWAVAVLVALFVLVVLLIVLKELSVFARLSRIDALHRQAEAAIVSEDLAEARKVVAGIEKLYAGRDDTRWGREKLAERQGDMFDAKALLELAEAEVLTPLDIAARQEVETAARQVATVTALVPIALADVFTALGANIRMIRRIGEIYGGRSGTLGSWRLLRAVMSHLVATGAVAVGDDMLEPFLGGGLLGKLSRRFGEGLVNGALTARVGVAAMEVCRPLPFTRQKRPSVRGIVKTALTGLFSKSTG
ncbi:TIGR01620 family protein [Mesobacterium sp. TK19101]|uniref:TIGR01620 family protein n=1 Tax=Mesobacterium hydrothermale TaxID=3111907 RepID=A0ABU6HHQ5_9RHOB|nr:TIGR01620 family protein [Mesobacterium sp. TK19101]MEC3861989.1 TIGR01620 family protein [Mesobacterium sp. TK19101]